MNAVIFWTGMLLALGWTWAVKRIAYRQGYDAGHLAGWKASSALATQTYEQTRPRSFSCPTCGPRVAVDDDGCCRTCGADTTVVGPYPA